MAQAETQTTNILPKMSIKTLGGNPNLAAKGENEPAKRVLMCRVFGEARGIKAATGNNGDPVFGLTGQFTGINAADGKEYQSGVLYLPSGVQELIQDTLEKEINDGNAKAVVEFALDLFAVSATNKAGYSFAAESPIPPTKSDAQARLAAAFKTPMPKPAPAIAAPAAS